MSVDPSLAKGLRSAIIRRIVASRSATDKAAAFVIKRKASMPTTRKGVRKMQAELSKYMDRFALASNDLTTMEQEVFWLRWALRQNVAMDNWEEDQLSVDGVVFDLFSPAQAFVEYDYQVGLSMHLIDRAFSRLNTMDNKVVLSELIGATLNACGLSYILFIELLDRGIKTMPLLIPTANGAIVGDVVVHEGGGDIQFRTFIGGKVELSPVKMQLREALQKWALSFQSVLGDGLQFGARGNFKIILDNLESPYIINFRPYVKEFLDIHEKYTSALDSRGARTQRAQQEYKKWLR